MATKFLLPTIEGGSYITLDGMWKVEPRRGKISGIVETPRWIVLYGHAHPGTVVGVVYVAATLADAENYIREHDLAKGIHR